MSANTVAAIAMAAVQGKRLVVNGSLKAALSIKTQFSVCITYSKRPRCDTMWIIINKETVKVIEIHVSTNQCPLLSLMASPDNKTDKFELSQSPYTTLVVAF